MASDKCPQDLSLTPLSVAGEGNRLVSSITHYLSTIPTPVDILEDLASIVAVTASLLMSLDCAVLQYPPFSMDRMPFVRPLCLDILAAFKELDTKVEEAREKGV